MIRRFLLLFLTRTLLSLLMSSFEFSTAVLHVHIMLISGPSSDSRPHHLPRRSIFKIRPGLSLFRIIHLSSGNIDHNITHVMDIRAMVAVESQEFSVCPTLVPFVLW